MAFMFLIPNHIERVVDEKTGELKTLRVNCTELAPRNFNINLIKSPAAVLQMFMMHSANQQPLMVPVREGQTSDGGVYFQLQPGQIIPVDRSYVESLKNQPLPVDTDVKQPFLSNVQSTVTDSKASK